MKITVLAAALILGLSSSVSAQNVEAVNSFDLNRYLGTWYEIARMPARFQRGCKDAKAVYERISSEKISVINSCIRNGKVSVAEGNAVVKGMGKLGVRFSVFQPFRAPYWVLWIDENYQTVAVGEPDKKFGWILSRSPQRSRASVSAATNALKENGYDTSKLIWD